jgi:hypothetical protein
MGWTTNGTVGIVGEGGLELKLLTSVIVCAPGPLSVERIVTRGGDEGFNGLAGVGDVVMPFDFATLETLAFTRIVGFVDGLSDEGRGDGSAEEPRWNEPLLRRPRTEEVPSVEVKERCLDNSWATRGAFGLEI